MNRVLDLDLDFFADRILHYPDAKDAADLVPWSAGDFRGFLEGQCGLSTTGRIPGRIFEDHRDAYGFWQHLAGSGLVEPPYSAVHVDAHSDIGYGVFGAHSFLEHFSANVMSLPFEARSAAIAADSQLSENNYVVYAGAARLLGEFVFVTHPQWNDDDIPWQFVRSDGPGNLYLFLAHYDPTVLGDVNLLMGESPLPHLLADAPIPMSIVAGGDFVTDQTFAAASLALSPGYSPIAPDLVEVFSEYVDLEAGSA